MDTLLLVLLLLVLLLLLRGVHDVSAAHAVEDEGEEAHGQSEEQGRQNRVAQPHVLETGPGSEKGTGYPDEVTIPTMGLGRGGKSIICMQFLELKKEEIKKRGRLKLKHFMR